jgi:enediyne polyketide synthase
MACQYADASSPAELWSNALAGRRAFRRMPEVRMDRRDYLAPDRGAPDRTYALEAAVIADYEFDRVRFRVAGSTFRSADLAHWLALDVASRALADAGFPDGEGLPKEGTGVLLGNTLTGEFSRANQMRLRWPYVRRVLEGELAEAGWSAESRAELLSSMEVRYKAPFPPIGEETLAGGLSNTIAGRICNHFDLKGGGYTVDGACASSLLAVTSACSSLVAGDLDIALAGGVDLSLDPFELIGFAKTGALAPEKMRVYDARSAGFWPGEGCGFVVLMRHEDAIAQGRRIYAVVRGWGVSSDGSGGITRPEVEGQLIALRRAYRRAGFGPDTVAYFEGHGTGTNVGDATELKTLSTARREADPSAPPAAIGSVKAIIGHTKAAAGVAGMIKATMALHNQIIPPTVGCETPHPELGGDSPALRVVGRGTLWPADARLRAGVSAMGFGGINAHVVMEGATPERRRSLNQKELTLIRSAQDAEIFLLGDVGLPELLAQTTKLAAIAPDLSRAELADLAEKLQSELIVTRVRGAVIASSPAELAERLELLRSWIESGVTSRLDFTRNVFLGTESAHPTIGFLFPGQGSPAHLDGGILRRRIDEVDALYGRANLPSGGDGISTDVAQPAIVTASLAALRVLDRYGIAASVGLGHSLGELTALHWAGAFDEDTLLAIARVRGRAMADLGAPTGAMASIAADAPDVHAMLDGDPVVIAGYNSTRQTVISGDGTAVAAVAERARKHGLNVTMLPVSHAFHSPLVAAAAEPLADALGKLPINRLQRSVISTVTGGHLATDADLVDLLRTQITAPVRFTDALGAALENVDLLIEVGPGSVLSGLAASMTDVPVIALDAGGSSIKGVLQAFGATFALGTQVHHRELFADRHVRSIDIDTPHRYFENPCEMAPRIEGDSTIVVAAPAHGDAGSGHGPARGDGDAPVPQGAGDATGASILDIVRELVAQHAELPPSAVSDGDRLLADLHLNSITISQIVVEAAGRAGLPAPAAPTEFANATVIEMAEALELLRNTGGEPAPAKELIPAGIDTWVRAFVPELVTAPAPTTRKGTADGVWRIVAPEGHPLALSLAVALRDAGGTGVAVCLPEHASEESIDLLLKGAAEARELGNRSTFLMVQSNGGAAAFARTLVLERPATTVCVVDLPFDRPDAAMIAAREARGANGYAEVYYDRAGVRRVPLLSLLPLDGGDETPPLVSDDLLLVTGGGKGIAAESALALARQSGAALLLLGRSHPGKDDELAANLKRMEDAGVLFRYAPVDVADADAVARAIGEGEEALGRPVTAFLHGAGANIPQLIDTLDHAAFARTLAPKIDGARNVLAAIDPAKLRLFVAFGSIIGRTGLRGEADYAVANDWLSRLVGEWRDAHPHCRSLSIEWSIWSGVGMGERLGRVEALLREGITPITPEIGLEMLGRLLSRDLPATAVVVSGRFGEMPTARLASSELPLLRYIEEPKLHYPGIELVAEATLTSDSDPYIGDHVFRGQRLLPAVLGLEAFAQVASALAGVTPSTVTFENLRFDRPIIVPEGTERKIRTVALMREDGLVELALRSDETAFAADHFRASCRFDRELEDAGAGEAWKLGERLPLEPDLEMYHEILFQRGRFQRLIGYRKLGATECIAQIRAGSGGGWFGRYLPSALLLGDPGARDAAIHCIQGCIPHMTLLPIAIERLTVVTGVAADQIFVHARERMHEGNTYLYDIDIRLEDGTLIERWEGLLLRAVERNRHRAPWSTTLLGPFVERRIGELVPDSRISVVINRQGELERRERSNGALREAIGSDVVIHRRGDGRPETNGAMNVSVAHAGDITLAVAGAGAVGCDMEPVVPRTATLWRDLLGEERFNLAGVLASETGEDHDAAATRVWAAGECLKKVGAVLNSPLVIGSSDPDGWVTLSSNSLVIGTYAGRGEEEGKDMVLAVVIGGNGNHS